MTMRILLVLLLLLSSDFTHAQQVDLKKQASKARSEGDALLIQGDLSLAIQKYTLAISLEPDSSVNYLKRSKAYERLKRPESALQDLTKALNVSPEDVNARKLRAGLFFKSGKCKEALSDWEYVVVGNAQDEVAKLELGRARTCVDRMNSAQEFISVRNWHSADAMLTQAIDELRTMAPELKKMRAKVRFEMGAHFECIADAGEVIKLDSNDVDALTLRGMAFFHTGDVEMAMRHAQDGLQSDPDHGEAKKLHKLVNAVRRGLTQAQKLLDENKMLGAALKLDSILTDLNPPQEVGKTLLLRICKLAGELKDRKWAKTACEKAISWDGNWMDARLTLAEALAATSDSTEEWEETVRAWGAALQLDQNNPQAQEGSKRADAALRQSKTKNYYKILSIARSATKADIKKAYRETARNYHPDRHAGLNEEDLKKMEKKFAECAEAYEVLSDDDLKQKYDRGEEVFPNQGPGQGGFHHQQQRRGGPGGFHFNFNF